MLNWSKVGPRDLGTLLVPGDRDYLGIFIQFFPFTGGLGTRIVQQPLHNREKLISK